MADDQLEPPALLLGKALVHAQQVAGEQRRLVAAGAGADFEHRGALVGGVARQQLDRQRALGLGQLLADFLGLMRRQLLELGLGGGVGGEAGQHLQLGAQPAHLARRRGDRLDLRIFLGQAHELVGREVGRGHRLGQLMLLRLDRDDPVERDGLHATLDQPPPAALSDPGCFARSASRRVDRRRRQMP